MRPQRARHFSHIIGAGEPQYEFDRDEVAVHGDRPDRLGFAQGLTQVRIGVGAKFLADDTFRGRGFIHKGRRLYRRQLNP